MNITRKDRAWYEIKSSVRLYVVKQLSGGWVVVGKTLGSPGPFGATYGGAVNLDVALDIACLLAAKDDKHIRNSVRKPRSTPALSDSENAVTQPSREQ